MLLFLGALAFGAMATGAWISADQTEQKSRESSKQNNRSFYYDKNGRMRHTSSGKKFTPQEIDKFFFPISLEDRLREIKEMEQEWYKRKFYCVRVKFTNHYFLSKEEAIEFMEKRKTENPKERIYLKDEVFSSQSLEMDKYLKDRNLSPSDSVYHFDFDKNVVQYKKKYLDNKR